MAIIIMIIGMGIAPIMVIVVVVIMAVVLFFRFAAARRLPGRRKYRLT